MSHQSKPARAVDAPKRLLAAVVAGLVGVAGGLLITGQDEPTTPAGSRQVVPGALRDFMAIFDPNEPLMIEGIQLPVAELNIAAQQVGYPLYRPEGESPSEVWVSADLTEAGLRYGDQLVIAYTKWPAGTGDILSRYARMAESRQAGYVTEIAGHPAWVTPVDAQRPGAPPVNVVRVTIDDVEVALLGRISLEDLLAKAARLQA